MQLLILFKCMRGDSDPRTHRGKILSLVRFYGLYYLELLSAALST